MPILPRLAGSSNLLPRSLSPQYFRIRFSSAVRWQSYCALRSQIVRIRTKKGNHCAFDFSHRRISTFRYTPLDSPLSTQPFIRLLKLHPRRGHDQIETSLQDVPLTSDLDYEAVSYCWGDKDDLSTITCNGRELEVPRRLEAVQNMRFPDKPRILWADAICINQKDTPERESQVQLMRSIFSNAKQTLIFLGDNEDKQAQEMSKFAFWSIKLGLSILWRRVDLASSPQIRVWDTGNGRCRSLAPFSFEFYLELIGMLRMPWFQRAWVVQEVVVSSKATIFWGSSQYDWQEVIEALKFMSRVNFPLAFIVTLENISTIEEERKFYKYGHSKLNAVLLRHQRCESKDPRDKIYSFCGLVGTTSDSHKPVRISYHDDVSKIYREVALKILEEDQSLDLLSRPPSLATSRVKNLPSWVPDWSISSPSTLTYAWGHGPLSLTGTALNNACDTPRFAASKGSKYSPKLSSFDALVVEGFQFDKIAEIGPIFHGVQVPYTVHSFPEIVREWIHHFVTLFRARNVFVKWQRVADVRSKQLYITGETMREAFLQTLSAAEMHDSERVRYELELWDRGTSFPFGLLYSGFVLVRNFITDRPFLLFEIQGRYALHRRVVRTQRGFLGLASHATEVGDDVMLCKGSTVPLIMRRGGQKEDEFRLVGDAYVHGIMNGEAFDAGKCQTMFIK